MVDRRAQAAVDAKESHVRQRVSGTTGAERVLFVNRELANVAVDFESGDIQSLVCAFLWADGDPGCNYHIEPQQKVKLIAWLRQTADRLENE